jgi:fructose-1,6-bisphosphatase/inositol monophosphatase family enzyme
MQANEDKIAEVAVDAARKAGEILRSHAGRHLTVDQATKHDLKLDVDRICEQAILDTITAAFPEHSILAEESGTTHATGATGMAGTTGTPSNYQWIVDPLDGTVNYYFGLPYFCTSIACYAVPEEPPARRDIDSLGRPVVGVIYAPPTDDLFIGRAGRGAVLNGRRIRAAGVKDLRESIIGIGFGKTDELGIRMLNASTLLADKVRKLRCLGAAAYDISNVACGRLSAFFEKGLRTWDIAAAYIILKEAGGVLESQEIAPTRWQVLATAPGIHDELKSILAQQQR